MTYKNNIQPIKSEDNDIYSDDDLYNINSWGADLSFRELITMYKESELIKPELQRHYVWTKDEASRFIESILMGLPVPSIFLAKANSKKLIIDGYQRIMTVYDFVEKGKFNHEDKIFKLSNSDKINSRWRGKAFKELSEDDQINIKSTTIHAIIFEQKSPSDGNTSLYQIFERINTGGRSLMPQEIRNCVYQGPFNDLLFELNSNSSWRILFGQPTIVDPRMRDMEYILRFFALNSPEFNSITTEQLSLKKFLNQFMGFPSAATPSVLDFRRDLFEKCMDFILNNIGAFAFRNIKPNGTSAERFHPTIFDAISIATAKKILNSSPIRLSSNFEKRRYDLLRNRDFKALISTRTTNTSNIRGRINLAYSVLYGE